jgi:hypothetical protein
MDQASIQLLRTIYMPSSALKRRRLWLTCDAMMILPMPIGSSLPPCIVLQTRSSTGVGFAQRTPCRRLLLSPRILALQSKRWGPTNPTEEN